MSDDDEPRMTDPYVDEDAAEPRTFGGKMATRMLKPGSQPLTAAEQADAEAVVEAAMVSALSEQSPWRWPSPKRDAIPNWDRLSFEQKRAEQWARQIGKT